MSILFNHLGVIKKEDIKVIIGRNLKRLRIARGYTQDKLGSLLKPDPIDGSHVAAIEGGKGVSDDILARLCNALDADIWEFSWTEKTPIVRDAREMADIEQRREAEKVGIADMVREAEASWIVAAKKKSGAVREDAAARPKRTHKRSA